MMHLGFIMHLGPAVMMEEEAKKGKAYYLPLFFLLLFLGFAFLSACTACSNPSDGVLSIHHSTAEPVPASVREAWVREAIAAVVSLHGPCPFAPFGAVFVDHTLSQEGVKICAGANHGSSDPTLHGEIVAIRNCVAQHGQPRIGSFFKNLSLYSTAEPCPMCMSALRWAGVREVIFATTIPRLAEFGWGMIEIRAAEVNAKSVHVRDPVPYLLGEILTNETDQFFNWQFDESGKCPAGCARNANKSNLCVRQVIH